MEELARAAATLPSEDLLFIGLTTLVLSAARMGALLYVFPLWTRTGVEGGVLRGGVALALSLPLLPTVAAELLRLGPPEPLVFAGLAAKEALLGLALGVVLGLPFHAASAAGNLIDFQRGASAATLVDPNAGEETTPFGVFLFLLFAATFLAAGLFERALLDALYGSFAVWPPLAALPQPRAEDAWRVLALLGTLLEVGLALAAPIVLGLLLMEVGLAVASRFVPQINVFFLAMAVKTLATMALIPLYFGIVSLYLEREAAAGLRALSAVEGFLR